MTKVSLATLDVSLMQNRIGSLSLDPATRQFSTPKLHREWMNPYEPSNTVINISRLWAFAFIHPRQYSDKQSVDFGEIGRPGNTRKGIHPLWSGSLVLHVQIFRQNVTLRNQSLS